MEEEFTEAEDARWRPASRWDRGKEGRCPSRHVICTCGGRRPIRGRCAGLCSSVGSVGRGQPEATPLSYLHDPSRHSRLCLSTFPPPPPACGTKWCLFISGPAPRPQNRHVTGLVLLFHCRVTLGGLKQQPVFILRCLWAERRRSWVLRPRSPPGCPPGISSRLGALSEQLA